MKAENKNAAFLDFLIENLKLKNDAALSRALGVEPPCISKIRHGKLEIGPTLILFAHEATRVPIRKLKDMAGLQSIGSLA